LLSRGDELWLLGKELSKATDKRIVEGVHPDETPVQVSRKKIFGKGLVSPATRLVAFEVNTTNRPSEVILASRLSPFASFPVLPSETRVVEGVHPVGIPRQVSRTNKSKKPFLSLDTRLLALEEKTTNRPVELSDARLLKPLD